LTKSEADPQATQRGRLIERAAFQQKVEAMMGGVQSGKSNGDNTVFFAVKQKI
jgi:hypothetical protein